MPSYDISSSKVSHVYARSLRQFTIIWVSATIGETTGNSTFTFTGNSIFNIYLVTAKDCFPVYGMPGII